MRKMFLFDDVIMVKGGQPFVRAITLSDILCRVIVWFVLLRENKILRSSDHQFGLSNTRLQFNVYLSRIMLFSIIIAEADLYSWFFSMLPKPLIASILENCYTKRIYHLFYWDSCYTCIPTKTYRPEERYYWYQIPRLHIYIYTYIYMIDLTHIHQGFYTVTGAMVWSLAVTFLQITEERYL